MNSKPNKTRAFAALTSTMFVGFSLLAGCDDDPLTYGDLITQLSASGAAQIIAQGADITLDSAALSVDGTLVDGGSDFEIPFYENQPDCGAGGSGASYSGPQVLFDMLGLPVESLRSDVANAGLYTFTALDLAPDPLSGETLRIEGSADLGGDLRTFEIVWTGTALGLVMECIDTVLDGGSESAITFDVALDDLLAPIDFFALDAQAGHVTIDEIQNSGALDTIVAGLAQAIQVVD